MPTWTLRLVACAGFVALLSRLPALDTAADAFVLGVVAGAVALAVQFGPVALRALLGNELPSERTQDGGLRPALPHPAFPTRLRSPHGADA